MLDDNQSYPVPDDTNPPATNTARLRTLKSSLKKLDLTLAAVDRVRNCLHDCRVRLCNLGQKMTEKERTAYDLAYEAFIDESDYTGPLKELGTYSLKLGRERNALTDSIEEVEDKLAVAAPALPPRISVAPGAPAPDPPEPVIHAPDLPKFDGDISNWSNFWSHFKYLVHESRKLPSANSSISSMPVKTGLL